MECLHFLPKPRSLQSAEPGLRQQTSVELISTACEILDQFISLFFFFLYANEFKVVPFVRLKDPQRVTQDLIRLQDGSLADDSQRCYSGRGSWASGGVFGAVGVGRSDTCFYSAFVSLSARQDQLSGLISSAQLHRNVVKSSMDEGVELQTR